VHEINRSSPGLYEFIKHKVEVENLYDYEVATTLKVSNAFIRRLRKTFRIQKANGFFRRFERTYGTGSIDRFKRMIEDPRNSLSDVAKHFGFSRENARIVYQKIYGYPYTIAYKKKLQIRRREKRIAMMSKRLKRLMKVSKKMKAMGLDSHIMHEGPVYRIIVNGYKLAFRCASKPAFIGNKQYFRFNNAKSANTDCDFFICLCGKNIHYIIPRHAMPKYGVFLSPAAGANESKYAHFREAWHLLDKKGLFSIINKRT